MMRQGRWLLLPLLLAFAEGALTSSGQAVDQGSHSLFEGQAFKAKRTGAVAEEFYSSRQSGRPENGIAAGELGEAGAVSAEALTSKTLHQHKQQMAASITGPLNMFILACILMLIAGHYISRNLPAKQMKGDDWLSHYQEFTKVVYGSWPNIILAYSITLLWMWAVLKLAVGLAKAAASTIYNNVYLRLAIAKKQMLLQLKLQLENMLQHEQLQEQQHEQLQEQQHEQLQGIPGVDGMPSDGR